MVVFQDATKSLTALDRAGDGIVICHWLDQFILQSLMISLAVIMLDGSGK